MTEKIKAMASVYIIFSSKINKFYIGSCLDLTQRILDHKNKIYVNSFTTVADDWELVFELNELDMLTARKTEEHIKSMKSKKYIENLIKYPEMSNKLRLRFQNP